MKKLLLGTGNPSKISSYRKLLAHMGFDLVTAKDLGIPEPEETASSFEEEAIRKAKYYYEKSKIPAIVDDGGFMIEALNGEPGLKSKRWIGREMTDEEIIQEVFKRMQGLENRKAKHHIHVGLATPFGLFTSHAELEGIVPDKPASKVIEKYPYRSVLYFPNYGKYWGELSEEEEQIMSHRKHAIEKLEDILKELTKD